MIRINKYFFKIFSSSLLSMKYYSQLNNKNCFNQHISSQHQLRHYPIKLNTQYNQLQLFILPIQPIKEKQNKFVINSKANVLALVFMDQYNIWSNRKTITLNFQDMCQLLQIYERSNRTKIITIRTFSQTSSTEWIKQLQIKDNPENEQIYLKLSLRSSQDKTNNQSLSYNASLKQKSSVLWEVNTTMSYLQYNVFSSLLKKQLYQASGIRFTIEMQKHEILKKIENNN